MTRPSERINEIYEKSKGDKIGMRYLTLYLDAILEYLDEEYEKTICHCDGINSFCSKCK